MNKKFFGTTACLIVLLILFGCGNQNSGTPRRQASGEQERPPANVANEPQTPQANRGNSRNCDGGLETNEQINLVIIVGQRANTTAPPTGGNLDDYLCQRIGQTFTIDGLSATSNVAFITSDSAPGERPIVNANGRPADLTVTANNSYMLNNRIQSLISHTILPFMDADGMNATAPEADLFEALHVAARLFRDMDQDRTNHLIIIDSGITTAGHLDMRDFNILETDVPTEILTRLKEASLLPDLNDVIVSHFNIGNVSAPQMNVSGPIEGGIREFWHTILTGSGATVHQMQLRSEGGTTLQVTDGFPFVSVVEFNVPEFDLSDLNSQFFPASSLGFIADTDQFVDEPTARAVIHETGQNLVAYLAQNPTHHIYIVGSQARGPANADGFDLSYARARRVKTLLVDNFHIDPNRLRPIGGGTTPLSWRNAEEFLDGEWQDQLAELNRIVAIIPSTAPEAFELRLTGLTD